MLTPLNSTTKCWLPALVAVATGFCALSARGEIVVDGLTTKSTHTGSATFTVPSEAGFGIVPKLDGVAIPLDAPHTESGPGYHELFVVKTPDGGGAAEERTVQFIVRDPARPSSDNGMPTWTPRPATDAPTAVLDATDVAVFMPSTIAPGASFPVVVRLTAPATGEIARLNGTALLSDATGRSTAIKLRRGAGAAAWTMPDAGPLTLTLRLGTRSISRQINPYDHPPESLSGTLAASRTFAAGARVSVGADTTVPAGMTLRFEAGCVVRLAAGATIDVLGNLEIAGTTGDPVLFAPADPAQAWGGFFLHGGSATATVAGAMLTGAGADQSWMSAHGFHSHRDEQAVFCFDAGTSGGTCTATLADTWIVDNPLGQAAHGRNAEITFSRCVIQRTRTSGQFNGGAVTVLDSHAMEFPVDSPEFVDGDNDAFYLTSGTHRIERSVLGWTKDDGIDCGGSETGTLTVVDCWVEGCFHEGFALSGNKVVTISGTVSTGNGQGIECGYSGSTAGRPDVTATDCLVAGNAHGARYGDNYDWTYHGKLAVADSLLLHNIADVFGYEWDSWAYRSADMTIENNIVTAALDRHPANTPLDPDAHAPLVAAFIDQPAAARGFAVADRPAQNPRSGYGGSVGLRLDRAASESLSIPWRVVAKPDMNSGAEIDVASGTLEFLPGQDFAALDLPPLDGAAAAAEWVGVLFDATPAAVPTGTASCHFLDLPGPPDPTLVAFGSDWRYLADGTDQGTAWRDPGFDASAWPAGPAELGYGDGDEATNTGYAGTSSSKNATTYFRHSFDVADPATVASLSLDLLYDDGAVVYLNGQRVAATPGMPAGDPAYDFYVGSASSENATATFSIPVSALAAGANTLAVEIHQANASSSDISFDLELVATPAQGTTIGETSARIDSRLHWFWTTPGVVPESSPDLRTWTERPDLASPILVEPTPYGPAREFFRLKIPTQKTNG